MKANRRVAWLVLVAAALSALVISTQVDGPPRTNEDRVRALSEDFACPTCDGQAVAESNAVVAQEIRLEIRRRVDAGDSDEEITAFLIGAFDESIDLRPRASGIVGLVWALPVFAMVFGVAGLAAVFTKWRNAAVQEASSEDTELVERLRRARAEGGAGHDG